MASTAAPPDPLREDTARSRQTLPPLVNPALYNDSKDQQSLSARSQRHDLRLQPPRLIMDGCPPADNSRFQGMPVYDLASGMSSAPPMQQHFMSPHSPMGALPQTYMEPPAYEQHHREVPRQNAYPEYTGTPNNAHKKRSPRTSQVCAAILGISKANPQ